MSGNYDLAQVEVLIEGTRPLLVHRGGLANPLDPHSKAIAEVSKKRGKSESDHLEIALREWRGSFYYSDDLGPYLPAEMLEACVVGGGKKHRLGTALKSGFSIDNDAVPIEYDGPRDLDGLEAAGDQFYLDSIVKVGQAKLVRRRPMFTDWAVRFTATYDPSVLDLALIEQATATAGRLVGMGDWRPRYGRFTSKITGE